MRISAWQFREARCCRARPGSSLVEAVAVMTLTFIVMAVIAGISVAQMRLARTTAEQAQTAEAVRTVTAVLSGEARRMTPVDIAGASTDSFALRAFRGAGIPCGTGAGSVFVRYSGDRQPDPAKDSVLVVGVAPEYGVMLFDAQPAPGMCGALPGETVMELETSGTIPQESVVLVFESGSYHLTTGALRYRIGAGGRQPLTVQALEHPYSHFNGVTPGGIRVQVEAGGRQSQIVAPFTPLTIVP